MIKRKFRVMSFTETMDKSLTIHKDYLGTSALYLFFMGLTIIPIVFIGATIITGLAFESNIGVPSYGQSNTFLTMFPAGIALFSTLLYTFFYVVQISGIFHIASNSILGQGRITAGKVYGRTFSSIKHILSVAIGAVLLIIPGIIVVWILFMAAASGRGGYQMAFTNVTILGLLTVCAWAHFVTLHIFSIHTAIFEKLHFLSALKRSREMVKGRFWRTLGSVIIFILISAAITYSLYSFFGVIFSIIYTLLGFLDVGPEVFRRVIKLQEIIDIPMQIINILFVTPITGILITVLYYNRRFEKEGYDLELELNNMQYKPEDDLEQKALIAEEPESE